MKTVKKTLLAVIVIAVLACLLSCLYVVQEDEYAYVTRFAKIIDVKSDSGLYFKAPFVDNVSKLPRHKMMYDLTRSEVLTGDKKTLVVDSFVVWRIDDPHRFVQTVTYVPEMEIRIENTVYSSVKNTLGQMIQTDIINAGESSREEINSHITNQVNLQLENYGVSILGAEIKRLDLPDANEQAVCERMVSEREQMAASYLAEGKYEAKKIENETDKEVAIILAEANAHAEQLRGEGESEYMRILAEAYGTQDRADYYQFIRALEAAKNSMTGEKLLVLPADSIIARVFTSGN